MENNVAQTYGIGTVLAESVECSSACSNCAGEWCIVQLSELLEVGRPYTGRVHQGRIDVQRM